MRKYFLLLSLSLTLIISLVLPSTSYAEWTKVSESKRGDTFYVDFSRIRNHSGYVFWWRLTNYLKPTKQGHLSTKSYFQGDCKLFRTKYLSYIFHKQPMGQGTGLSYTPKEEEWIYPSPNSVEEDVLKKICNNAKGLKSKKSYFPTF